MIALEPDAKTKLDKTKVFISNQVFEVVRTVQTLGNFINKKIDDNEKKKEIAKQHMKVTKDILFSNFEPNVANHGKIMDMVNKQLDLKYFLRDHLDAKMVVMYDRVQI